MTYVDFGSSNIHYFRMTPETYCKKLYNKVAFDLWRTRFPNYFVTSLREVMEFAFTRAHCQAVLLPRRNIHLLLLCYFLLPELYKETR